MPVAGGLLVGNTYGTDGTPQAGVSVSSASQTTYSSVTADPLAPDSFYNLFLPVGTQVVTATAAGLPAINATSVMSDRLVLQQDFNWQVAFTDASLKTLAVSNGQLSPGFSPDVLDYSSAVGYDVNSLGLSFSANQPGATISFNDSDPQSGVTTGTVALQTGVNLVTIEVTALDGKTIQTYTITVTRAAWPTSLYLPYVKRQP